MLQDFFRGMEAPAAGILIHSGKWLMKIRNKVGPRTLPCRTPLTISIGSDSERPMRTD
jgi:hypothetical protein